MLFKFRTRKKVGLGKFYWLCRREISNAPLNKWFEWSSQRCLHTFYLFKMETSHFSVVWCSRLTKTRFSVVLKKENFQCLNLMLQEEALVGLTWGLFPLYVSIEIQLIMIYLIYMTTECLLVLWRSIILDRSQVQSLAFYNGGAVSICCNYYICECFYYILLILSDNESVESVLQLKFDKNETVVLASTANGFAVWFLMPDEENQNIREYFWAYLTVCEISQQEC